VVAHGQTVTMALPMRGNVQVRVAELGPTLLTLQTVEGHPLAGAVRFSLGTAADGGALRFMVEIFARAANTADRLAMALVGGRVQHATWIQIVENVVRESGGSADDGVQSDETTVDDAAAAAVDAWLRELALARHRERNSA